MAKTDIEKMSIATIAAGAVIEALDYELQRVFDNVIDPNTKADATRKVTLTISIKPDANRDMAAVSFIAKSTLQPADAVAARVAIYDSRGTAEVTEYVKEIPSQHTLPGVTDINEARVSGVKE